MQASVPSNSPVKPAEEQPPPVHTTSKKTKKKKHPVSILKRPSSFLPSSPKCLEKPKSSPASSSIGPALSPKVSRALCARGKMRLPIPTDWARANPFLWLRHIASTNDVKLDWSLVNYLFQFDSSNINTLRKHVLPLDSGSSTTSTSEPSADDESSALTTSIAVPSCAPIWPKEDDKALSDVLCNLVAGEGALPRTTPVRSFESIIVPPRTGFEKDEEKNFLSELHKRNKLRTQVRRYAQANRDHHYRVTILVLDKNPTPPMQFRVYLNSGKRSMSKAECPDFVALGLSGLFDWLSHWKYEMQKVGKCGTETVFDVILDDVCIENATESEVKSLLKEHCRFTA